MMKKTTSGWVMAAGAGIVFVVATVLLYMSQPAPAKRQSDLSQTAKQPRKHTMQPEVTRAYERHKPNAASVSRRPAPELEPEIPQAAPPAGAAVTEVEARAALSFVGFDPIADEVWFQAINDPSLPPNARRNLIEDLNEDGFRDFRNLTPDDLPLIVSRIEIIEFLTPSAMDDVNAAAFQEAYKDLLNMYARVVGRTER